MTGRVDAEPTEEVVLRRVVEEDWPILRAVRLAMLLDAPDAYGSTFAREVAFDDAAWRARAASTSWLALEGARPVGAVALVPHASGAAQVTAMWVAPPDRGAGIGRRLLAACREWALGEGHGALVLHVMADNAAASTLYRRVGFVATGDACDDVPGCGQMRWRLDAS